MDPEIFKNCSNFTEALVLVEGISSAVCCSVLSVVLVALVILTKFYTQRICGTFLKRFTIGLLPFTTLLEFTFALQLKYFYDPPDVRSCEAVGFIHQLFISIHLLFAVGIFLIWFVKILKVTTSLKLVNEYYKKAKECTYTCYSWKINKLEIAFYVSVFVLLSNSYGPIGPWCGFQSLESNCSIQEAAIWDVIGLWIAPAGLVTLLTFALSTASLFLLCYAMKNTKLQKLIEVDITVSIMLLDAIFIPITSIVSTMLPLQFGWWVTWCIVPTVFVALIPLVLLLVIHLPLPLMIVCLCQKHQGRRNVSYGERDQATVQKCSGWSIMHQPSHTTWSPSHEDLENAPLIREQQPNYGTNSNR